MQSRYILSLFLALPLTFASLSAEPPAPSTPRILRLTGDLMPRAQARIFSRVSGVVVKVPVREAQMIKTGEILAEIDPVEYEIARDLAAADLERAEARLSALEAGSRPEELARAAAEVAGANAELRMAKLNHARMTGLLARGGSTRQLVDESHRAEEVASSRLVAATKTLELARQGPRAEEKRAARAETARARSELRLAELRLGYTKVRAPFDGVIGQRLIDEGAYVLAASSPNAPPLVILSQSRVIKAILDIPEREMPFVRVGQEVKVFVRAAPGLPFPGRVSNLYPYVDPKTRNGRLEVLIPNWPVKLVAGMFVNAELVGADSPAATADAILGGYKPGVLPELENSRGAGEPASASSTPPASPVPDR